MKDAPTQLMAAIDIGSSAIRMDVAEVRPGRTIRVLESLKKGVQLGRETFTQGYLSQETIRAACRALQDFKKVLDTYGVSSYRAVSTSAVRESDNSETFLDRLRTSSGLEVEIINGPEENRLTLLAVMQSIRGVPDLTRDTCLLVEVGGGSTDVSLLDAGELRQSGSFPLGSIRLRAEAETGPANHDERVRFLQRRIGGLLANIRRAIGFEDAARCVALGGDVRFASRVLGAPALAGGITSIGRDDFEGFVRALCPMPVEELVCKYSISYLDAETLVPALLTYLGLLAETRSVDIAVSDASIRAGILADMAPGSRDASREKLRGHILASARSLGRKFHCDETHAERVRALAARLFDELRIEHRMTDTHRLYLEIAALLHDAGLFVSPRAHHKHSLYLIASSELFGLRNREMDLIANIARYHRRDLPQRSHESFTALDRNERVIVSKLAAILRVANALDKDHLETAVDLRIAREGDQIILEAPDLEDLTLARFALDGRSNLFAEVFGKSILLRGRGAPA